MANLFKNSIFMSERPRIIPDFLKMVSNNKIKTIVILMESHEIYQYYGRVDLIGLYKKEGINVIHFPIQDYNIPKRLLAFDDFIDELYQATESGNTLVHCVGGRGRTGTAVACLLVKYKNMKPKEAIQTVRKYRKGTVETPQQEEFVSDYSFFVNFKINETKKEKSND